MAAARDRVMCTSPLAIGWSPKPLLVPQCSCCICSPAAELTQHGCGRSPVTEAEFAGAVQGSMGCGEQVQLHTSLPRAARGTQAGHCTTLTSPDSLPEQGTHGQTAMALQSTSPQLCPQHHTCPLCICQGTGAVMEKVAPHSLKALPCGHHAAPWGQAHLFRVTCLGKVLR